jgi:hypothetical protein
MSAGEFMLAIAASFVAAFVILFLLWILIYLVLSKFSFLDPKSRNLEVPINKVQLIKMQDLTAAVKEVVAAINKEELEKLKFEALQGDEDNKNG